MNKSSPTIITTTFDGRLPWLKDLIECILTFTHLPFELIVVDNGTTDGTKQFLSSMRWARTVCNATNLDDTLGINQALQIAYTDYIVKIDTDALIGGYGWWEEIHGVMEAAPQNRDRRGCMESRLSSAQPFVSRRLARCEYRYS